MRTEALTVGAAGAGIEIFPETHEADFVECAHKCRQRAEYAEKTVSEKHSDQKERSQENRKKAH